MRSKESIKTFFCATSFFYSKMLLTMSDAVFRQKIGDLKITHGKIIVSWIPFLKP